MIYHLVVPQNDINARTHRIRYPHGARNQRMIVQPGLCQVSRSVRSEALPLFFQLREFHILVERGSDTLKMLQQWLRRLAPASLQNLRHLRITFRQTFKLTWIVYLGYYLRKLPSETLLHLHAMGTRDRQKFVDIAASYKKLNSGKIPRVVASDSLWYYPWKCQKIVDGRSYADLIFPACSAPPSTPCCTPRKGRLRKSSSTSGLTSSPEAMR